MGISREGNWVAPAAAAFGGDDVDGPAVLSSAAPANPMDEGDDAEDASTEVDL